MAIQKKTIKEKISFDFKFNRALLAMLLIPTAFIVVFSYMPIYGVQIAFREYHPLRNMFDSQWVGLKYFIKFFTSYQWKEITRNTLIISFYELCTAPIPMIFAFLLTYLPSKRLRKSVQTVSFAPHFISTVVICGMLLQFLRADGGVINNITGLFGMEAKNYMAYAQYYRRIYIWSGVWQSFGYSAILYIAALTNASPELHEAAIIDGANIFKRILHIDWPCVVPTFCILLVLNCANILKSNSEKILLLQNNINLSVSETISTFTYRLSFDSPYPQYSYSAAVGMITSLVSMIILIIVNKASKNLEDKYEWQ